jgi:hypothetical protein
MTAPTTTPAAQQYLAAVADELADLPVEERADLLEDLAAHLAALDAEEPSAPVALRLGTPSAYAAELRAAAGLPPREARTGRLRLAAVTGAWHAALGSRAGREVRAFAPQLLPAWWVVRGVLVVWLPAVNGADPRDSVPVPSVLGSPVLGAVLVGLAVVLSVRLGRARLRGATRALVTAGGAALALWALVTVVALEDRAVAYVYTGGGSPVVGYEGPLQSFSGPVTDIYPYAADGTPLEGVLLYDQDGRPLRPAQQEWFADRCRRVLAQPRAADGVPVPHSFPQQYVLDPRGETLDGSPAAPGQCVPERPRPQVPLPVFPPATSSDESGVPPASDLPTAPAPQEAP